MKEQAWRILHRLRGIGPALPAQWLADDLAIPAASLRRSLSELRSLGYDISITHGVVALREHRGLLRRAA